MHKELSDFIRAGGIECMETQFAGHTIILANSAQTGRTTAILPVCVSASDPSAAETESEGMMSLVQCLKAGYGEYPLIITEDRWRSQQNMMKARLLAHLEIFDQIYARNCEIRKIDKNTAAAFLKANHSYGDAACRYRYGLFLKRHTGHIASESRETVRYPAGTLMAVATFSNARKWNKGGKVIRSYEWTRYASVPGARLSGGMGKLLKAFIEEVRPDDIMTYADLEWSEGKVYERLGFELEGKKSPVNFAVDTNDWNRYATKAVGAMAACRFYTNFGSNKYRLKLTDYQ